MMGKLFALPTILLITVMVGSVYTIKSRTKLLRQEVTLLRMENKNLRSEIVTMRVEKEHLERPEHLRPLALAMGLEPLTAAQSLNLTQAQDYFVNSEFH